MDVTGTTCPALNSPRGGGMQVCGFLSGDFDACSASCPASSADLVEDVPRYYTCGPSGSWEMLQDQGGLYPTCGRKLWLFLLFSDIVGFAVCSPSKNRGLLLHGLQDRHKPVFRCLCFCPLITLRGFCVHVSPLNKVAGTGGQKEAYTPFCLSYQATTSQCFLACASVLL